MGAARSGCGCVDFRGDVVIDYGDRFEIQRRAEEALAGAEEVQADLAGRRARRERGEEPVMWKGPEREPVKAELALTMADVQRAIRAERRNDIGQQLEE